MKALFSTYRETHLPQRTGLWHVLRQSLPILILLVAAGLLMLWRLEDASPWWDEGWTLLVARNWFELGHYGQIRGGVLEGPGLSAAFPSVASIVLSFQLFGVGIWQSRLPLIIYTLVAIALLYGLAQRLYSQRIAMVTVLVLMFLTPHQAMNPLVVGRHVLAEPIMICFLLAGYAAFLAIPRQPLLFWILALGCWAISIIAKRQTLPFWALSLIIPCLLALLKRDWKTAGEFAIALSGAWVLAQLTSNALLILLNPEGKINWLEGLTNAVALVTQPSVRLQVLVIVIITALPLTIGIAFAVWKTLLTLPQINPNDRKEMTKLALLSLTSSWLAWFLLLSVDWSRYLYAVAFVGSLFIAVLLNHITNDVHLEHLLDKARHSPFNHHLTKQEIINFCLVVLLLLTGGLTLSQLYLEFFRLPNTTPQQTAQFLNTQTTPGALIESYEPEVLFLTNRPSHFPPAQLNVDVIRRVYLHESIPNSYDPLLADPDYIVLGFFGQKDGIYEEVLHSQTFRLIQKFGSYEIYERVR